MANRDEALDLTKAKIWEHTFTMMMADHEITTVEEYALADNMKTVRVDKPVPYATRVAKYGGNKYIVNSTPYNEKGDTVKPKEHPMYKQTRVSMHAGAALNKMDYRETVF